jgi:hypothetical protein
MLEAIWYNRWKYTALLLALLLLLVAHPLVNGDQAFLALLYGLLLATVFLLSILALFQRSRSRVLTLVLGIPTVVGVFTHYLMPPTSPVWTSRLLHLSAVVFLGYTVALILRGLFVETDVSADDINGAFCGYLLIGLAFGHLYCLTESFWPDSFLLQEHLGSLPAAESRRHSLLAYFSLITLTTLGYGDILPRSTPARTLAAVEAVLGQFYLAVVIAELIARKVSAAIREQRSDRPPTPGSK